MHMICKKLGSRRLPISRAGLRNIAATDVAREPGTDQGIAIGGQVDDTTRSITVMIRTIDRHSR